MRSSILSIGVLFGFATVAAHYGDPYKLFGCEKDEMRIRITGIPGEICSPPCNTDGSCPTDVPAGVTAKPECVLSSSQGGPKYCALVCSENTTDTDTTTAEGRAKDAQCGKNASCKKATDNGICTYDDAPQPPSSAHWKPINSPTFAALSEALSVAFTPDGKTGFTGSGTNGVGVQILKSVDSGVTWNVVWPAADNKTHFDLFLGSACKSATSAVITGAIFQTYTTDGQHFKGSLNDELEPSQDAKVIKASGKYAIAVNGKVNGVATSETGFIWKNINMTGVNPQTYPARYGAYPSADTWYLTAGTFPTNNTDKTFKHLNSKLKINKKTRHYHLAVDGQFHLQGNEDKNFASADDGFTAGIFKTTDGGGSWTQVFEDDSNTIYPNGIDCFSDDHCIAVMEGGSCQILVTTTGGKNWTVANRDNDSACSLTYVSVISDTEAWVGGGHMASLDFEGRFWHTTDGGQTWVKEAIKGVYIFDLDMQSATSGYAVALTQAQGVALFRYNSAGLN